jgi:peptidoglycan/xylan/chitin deacetylase (PgdA/CDA1 family)
MTRHLSRTTRMTASALALALVVTMMPIIPSVAVAARSPLVSTQAVVAIHVSEYTSALTATLGAAAPSDDLDGWYNAGFTYSMVHTMLEESLRADGTPFVEISDADIESGALLADGTPRYPIVFSLMAEAASDAELAAISAYAQAGGFVYVGGSSFTRQPDGTFRVRADGTVQSGLSAEMGLESVSIAAGPQGRTWSWADANTIRRMSNDPIVSHLTADADLSWPLPARYDSDAVDLLQVDDGAHPVWATRPTAQDAATVLAAIPALADYPGTQSVLVASKQFGEGRFIFQSEMAPLAGWAGFVPDTYEYLFIRRAIEAAFVEAGLPVVRLAAWPYAYHAAIQTRWDCDFYPGAISQLAAIESAFGLRGQYFVSTEQVNDAGAGVVALASEGAIIGSHSYTHTGPDTVDPATGATNIRTSLDTLQGWLGERPTVWVAPRYQSVLDRSFEVLEQEGIETAGEQGFGPFPHFALSMTDPGKHYDVLQVPTVKWLPSSATDPDARARMDRIPEAEMSAIVDFYYGLGALINVYGHPFTANQARLTALLTRAQQKGDVWFTDSASIRDWWVLRDTVAVSPSTARVGDRLETTIAITGATDPSTTVDLAPPGLDANSLYDIHVTLDGVPTSDWRVTGSILKVKVGTASTVVVSWPADAVDTTPPSPPTSVAADHTLAGGTVRVTWTDPADLDFSHVHVYRSIEAGTLGSRVAEFATGLFTDSGLENGTVYHYTLRAVDLSGNESADSAQVPATPEAPPPSVSNTMLDFDAVDDYVAVPYAEGLNTPAALTAEAWINVDAFQTQPMILSRWDGAQLSWNLYYQSDGRVRFYVRTPGGGGYVQATTAMGALDAGAWHHVAGVLDPVAQQLRIYVDGILKATVAYTVGSANASTARLFVNATYGGGTLSGLGDAKIDEARVSSSVRYTGDVFAPALRFETDADTVGLWTFDDAAGTVAVDAAQGNNGTLVGDPDWMLQGAAWAITPSAGAGGSIAPSAPHSVPAGSDRTLAITPDTGYHVESVLVDGVSVGAVTSYAFSHVAADHTIAATFGINTYTLASSGGAGGTVSGTQVVDHGSDSASFTITPATGYHVSDVLVDGVSVGAVTSYKFASVTASHTIAATFVRPTRFEQTDERIVRTGSWTTYASAARFSGGSCVYTNLGPAATTVRFEGTSIDVIGTKGAAGGLMRFTLDGAPQTVSVYSTTTANKQVVWSASGLGAGPHTLKIEHAGTSPEGGTYVWFDAVDVAGGLLSATRTVTPSAGANGSISPATAQVLAYGSDSASFTPVPNKDYHVETVTIDGVPGAVLTSYKFSNVTADHTIAVTFDRNVMTRFEQDAPGITYAGLWKPYSAPSLSGGTYLWARWAGSSVTVNFHGTAIDWITQRCATGGIAQVYLDGVSQGTVDLYNATNVLQARVWGVSGISDEDHTLRIEWTGMTSSPAADNPTYIGLDAVDVLGYLVAP